jgi:hypothetical protein
VPEGLEPLLGESPPADVAGPPALDDLDDEQPAVAIATTTASPKATRALLF